MNETNPAANRLGGWTARRANLVVGTCLAVVSAASYASYGHRTVFARWSPLYASILAAYGLSLALLVLWSVRRTGPVSPAAKLFDAAVLLWGGASVAAALGAGGEGSRIADGAPLGSTVPAAVLFDGFSIAFLIAAGVRWFWARRRASWGGVALTVATCAVLFGVAEMALRIRAIVAPRTQGFPTYTSGLWLRRYVRLNRAGFRDHEHAAPEPGASCRLAVVGDSFAFGMGIASMSDRFGERLANELASSTGVAWVSINASRGDTHTLDHIAFLRDIASLRPDIVVLLYVFNDVDYLRPAFERDALTETGSLLGRLRPDRLAFRNSFFVQEAYLLLRLGWAHRDSQRRDAVDPYRDTAVVARHLTDLKRFVTTGTAFGAVVRIVPIDMSVAGGGYPMARYRALVAAGSERGLPMLSLTDAFIRYRPSDLTVSRFDGHPNAGSYRLAATTIRDSIAAAARTRACMQSAHQRP